MDTAGAKNFLEAIRLRGTVKAMGMSGISKSQVSRLWVEIDERGRAFLNRQIVGAWPYLWIDATYLKVLEAGRICPSP